MMFQRTTGKIWNMKCAWLPLTVAILLFTGTCESKEATSDEPANSSSSVLILSNKNLTLNDTDIKILRKNLNITELYLNNNAILALHNNSFRGFSKLVILNISNNCIQTVEQAAFVGLNQLKELYLQNNKITHLDSSVFVPLKSLNVLSLQNNNLGFFDIEVPLNLTTVTLFGNPWNCSCGLLSLQTWLNNAQITIENEKNTTCTFPDSLKTQSIKTAILSNCDRREETKAITKSPISVNDTGPSAHNETDGRSLYSGFQPLGKSWKFLIAVLTVIVTTSMLIIAAIKFPAWYRHLISYNHSRLDEDEPGMFEEEFSTDMYSFPSVPDTNENDSVVVFEQYHTFAPEEDGFIEDKYIDT